MVKIISNTLIKRQDNVPWKEIEKEGILLKLEDGDYFTVNEIGLFIWKLLNGTKNLEEIAHRISLRYNVNKDIALSDLLKFTKSLHQKGLVAIHQ